jgi:hypothetical protein
MEQVRVVVNPSRGRDRVSCLKVVGKPLAELIIDRIVAQSAGCPAAQVVGIFTRALAATEGARPRPGNPASVAPPALRFERKTGVGVIRYWRSLSCCSSLGRSRSTSSGF